jgi:predicted nucleic acid-binding protein
VQTLVDASVWIDYFTGEATPQTDLLDSLLGKTALTVADLTLAEVLYGIPDERSRRLAADALTRFWLVEVRSVDLAQKSAVNYHTLRVRGIETTTTECEIATFCLEHGFALLHSSPGYEPFETYLGLKTVK